MVTSTQRRTDASRRLIAMATMLMLWPALAVSRGAAPSAAALHLSLIVRGAQGAAEATAAAVRDAGGAVVRRLDIIDGVLADIAATDLGRLASDPRVRMITEDGPVHLAAARWNPTKDTGSAYDTTLMSGAQAYWRAGYTGQGIDVAVLDSGVAPVEGLSAPGKVLNGPDLSAESQAPNLRYLDTFGHGTHIAGIIAGRDTAAVAGQYAGDSADFIGMAPDARIVSIKVADSWGQTDVSQVLAGIDWVVQHHADPGLNIRVLNLSFGTDSYQSYLVDPLSYAAETAWHSGVVVVAATGNAGWKTGVLDPASNPYVIAVGATDAHGTTTLADDTVATFSSGGDGYRNPDLIAPGSHIVSLRDPGSHLDLAYPSAVVAGRFFRGSGTSQATGVVSGAAALVLSQHPLFTVDQVKALLTGTASALPGQPAGLAGAGELNLNTALTALPPLTAVQVWAPSTGTGSIEGARGSVHLTWNSVQLSGEVDIFGSPISTSTLASQLTNGQAWARGTFNGVAWTGDGWLDNEWACTTWTASSWSGDQWSGNQWSGNQWSGNQWSGNQWSGNQWSGNQWSGNQWSGNQWSSASWD